MIINVFVAVGVSEVAALGALEDDHRIGFAVERDHPAGDHIGGLSGERFRFCVTTGHLILISCAPRRRTRNACRELSKDQPAPPASLSARGKGRPPAKT